MEYPLFLSPGRGFLGKNLPQCKDYVYLGLGYLPTVPPTSKEKISGTGISELLSNF
jgi:hypothetical protein